ncbi:hypothetical protein BCY84_06240 [Trypanosoma cruzi cruzi]|nr:hypothetical protein BCY84_06240 [Trypanosoma cruzi cruzi]
MASSLRAVTSASVGKGASLTSIDIRISPRWFRLMQFNMMTDAWSPGGNANATTTPVHGVQARVPGFTRTGADPDAYYPYDPSVDKELPPFLQPDFRRAYLVNEIRYYDPDIVCLQEVNRVFFNDVLWKYIRYCGYGTLYQSSRGYKVRALRRGDNHCCRDTRARLKKRKILEMWCYFTRDVLCPFSCLERICAKSTLCPCCRHARQDNQHDTERRLRSIYRRRIEGGSKNSFA